MDQPQNLIKELETHPEDQEAARKIVAALIRDMDECVIFLRQRRTSVVGASAVISGLQGCVTKLKHSQRMIGGPPSERDNSSDSE